MHGRTQADAEGRGRVHPHPTPPLPVHVVGSDYTYAAVNHLSCTHPRGRELLLTLSRPFPLKERLKVLLK